MSGKVVGLVAAVALLASIGIANAKGPVKLTDVQLDKITAGDTQTSVNVAATQELNTLVAISTQTLNNLTALSNFELGFFNAFSTVPLLP
jgi:hypothetical protein